MGMEFILNPATGRNEYFDTNTNQFIGTTWDGFSQGLSGYGQQNAMLPNTSINTSTNTNPTTNINMPAGYVKGPDGKPIVAQAWGDMTGLQKISTGVSMAAALANIWSGVQQNRLARQNFNFQKGIMETNLANQISSYNNALEDRMNLRYSAQEKIDKADEINAYLDRNRAVNRMA